MNTIHPQYITDKQGNKVSVIIPFAEYEQIVKQLDELDDVRLHVSAKSGRRPSIPLDEFVRQRMAYSKPLPPQAHSNESHGEALL